MDPGDEGGPNRGAASIPEGDRTSLRAKLIGVVAVSSICSVLATAVLLASYYSLTARREALSELSRQAEVLAEEVGRIWAAGGELTPGPAAPEVRPGRRSSAGPAGRLALRAVLASGRLDYVGVWQIPEQAAIRPGSGGFASQPVEIASAGTAAPTSQGLERVFADLRRGAQPRGEIETESSGSALYAARGVPGSGGSIAVIVARRSTLPSPRVLVRLGLALAFGLGVSAALAYWLSRRILAPVAAMERAALAIAQGDYSVRVEPPRDKELGRLADAINRMAAEVQAARAREKSLLMTVSHDLRTPLTSIRAYAEGISDGTIQSREEVARAAAVIASEAERLGRLVDVLFDAARLGSGQIRLASEEVDLCDLVEDVVSVFSRRAEAAGISLVTRCAGEPRATTDGDRLAQVLSNLIDNALAHTPSGGRVEIGVSAVEAGGGGIASPIPGGPPGGPPGPPAEGGRSPGAGGTHMAGAGGRDSLTPGATRIFDAAATHSSGAGPGTTPIPGADSTRGPSARYRFVLWVSDTGSGIPPEDLARIFEPGYSSGRRSDGGPGLGLGLAISHAIVTALGGSIEARSTPGQGATFSVYLP